MKVQVSKQKQHQYHMLNKRFKNGEGGSAMYI
jgi:hypothetical protein